MCSCLYIINVCKLFAPIITKKFYKLLDFNTYSSVIHDCEQILSGNSILGIF